MKNITKIIQTILFTLLIGAMILPFSSMEVANAKIKTDKNNDFEILEKIDYKIKKQLKKEDKERIKEKIKKDKKISKYFKNKSVTNHGYSYTGNIYDLSINAAKPLDIIMHYTVDNESLTVLVDGRTEKVIDFQIRKISGGLLPDNGLIISQYDGPSIRTLKMDYNAPDYSPNGVGWTGMLVNAAKNDSISANACNPSKMPTTYWAQNGLLMNQNGMEIIWADTSSSCIPQYFTTSVNKPNPGDMIMSIISTNPISNHWLLVSFNWSDGSFYSHGKTISGTSSFKMGTGLTSIFFENPNNISENWNSAYTTNPKINESTVRYVSDNSWHNWENQIDYVTGCDPGGYGWSHYASGSLNNDGITYDVNNIKQNCGVQ